MTVVIKNDFLESYKGIYRIGWIPKLLMVKC